MLGAGGGFGGNAKLSGDAKLRAKGKIDKSVSHKPAGDVAQPLPPTAISPLANQGDPICRRGENFIAAQTGIHGSSAGSRPMDMHLSFTSPMRLPAAGWLISSWRSSCVIQKGQSSRRC
jgi:hypothetical protein